MFENLISQNAANLLMDDISSGKLPPSVLFYGPPAEGKMTAALELARVLSCGSGTAPWACDCRDCAMHRALTHPDLAITGPRDCILEIRASAATFLASRAPGAPAVASRRNAARFLFVRSIRKLTARFSVELNDGDDARFARAMPLLASVSEALEELESTLDAVPEGDPSEVEKLVSSLVDYAARLEDEFLPDGVPVSVIRNAASWARLTPYGRKKVLVVENADRMQESARNAFLKILEEPPRDAMFVLTTSRRGAIIPTILSRVRTYAFTERQASDREEVVSRVFRDALAPGETLSGYFDRFLPVSPETIRASALEFLSIVLSEALDAGLPPLTSLPSVLESYSAQAGASPALDGPSIPAIVSALNKCKPAKVWRLFLSQIIASVSASVRTGQVSARESAVYAKWLDSVRLAQTSADILNISPTQVLERLSFEMRDAL